MRLRLLLLCNRLGAFQNVLCDTIFHNGMSRIDRAGYATSLAPQLKLHSASITTTSTVFTSTTIL
jgi:hypothetical protein